VANLQNNSYGLRLEWLSPAELAENPRNWRSHPPAQVAALTDALSEVGWAGACLYNERTGRLIDGHARKKVALEQGSERVPVLVGSWSEEQEAKILATLDPLAAMAEADAAKLDALLRDVSTGSEALSQMIAELAQDAGVIPADAGAGDTPFAEFGPAVTDDGFVAFKFGDYSGRVGKEVYDSFVETYKQRQQDEAEPMLDDVLRGWLGV
jgi:hypothetical protein